ncbi:MAG TPA: hypothetical protein VIU14_10785 [Mesorhizobium sp.]
MTERYPSGSIVNYPYLWRWQRDEGRENAEKDRPVCLAISLWDREQGVTHLVILAISGTPPSADQTALEIPSLEIRRAGLSMFKRGWITVSEYNYNVAERSYHFESKRNPRGLFSPQFMHQIRQAIRPMLAGGASRIDRTM